MEWNVIDEKLVANFNFKSQTELVQFLLKVANYADEINHHPDCKIHKAFQLDITLYSHDKNKITKLDYQLAQKIDDLFH
ncbi:4a-hydroxytetrahydrobiopterin dehydratase [Flavobacterium sp.]|jgi:4a-hydroxytetrahydrobiopterin dehydratase|uniref:4a-hydroxytetrahydrobiopterin dehydratase n=1 Tax=Flavobacterium sp. TaxID=239 RepID=UPI0037C00A3D